MRRTGWVLLTLAACGRTLPAFSDRDADAGGGAGAGVRTEVAPAQAPFAIRITSSGVYWTNCFLDCTNAPGPGVMRLPEDGGAPMVLAEANCGVALAVSSTTVYWAEQHQVKQVPIDGGPARVALDLGGSQRPTSLALTDGWLFVTAQNVQTAGAPNPTGGDMIALSTDSGAWTKLFHIDEPSGCCGQSHFLGSLATDGTHLFWGSGTAVVRSTIDGSEQAVLTLGDEPGLLALDRQFVCWPEGAGFAREPLAGGDAEILSTSTFDELTFPSSLAAAGGAIFWTDEDFRPFHNLTAVRTLPLDGGVAAVVAPTESYPYPVAADDPAVYFGTLPAINDAGYDCRGALVRVSR